VNTTTASQEILDSQSALALEALRMALAEFADEARTTDRSGGIHTPQGLRWLDGWVDGIGRLAQDAKHKGLWVICVALRTAVMRLMSHANRGEFKGLVQLEALWALLESYLAQGDVHEVLSALARYFETTGHQAWTLGAIRHPRDPPRLPPPPRIPGMSSPKRVPPIASPQ
jgi:hypothetical protein